MPDVTVKQLAVLTKKTVSQLLEQLQLAGVSINDENQILTEQEKRALLTYLHTQAPVVSDTPKRTKVTLTHQKVSKLSVSSGAAGRGKESGAAAKRTVKVTVRKRRTHDLDEQGKLIEAAPPPPPEVVAALVEPTITEGSKTEKVEDQATPEEATAKRDEPSLVVVAQPMVGVVEAPTHRAGEDPNAKHRKPRDEAETSEEEAAKKAKKRTGNRTAPQKVSRKELFNVVVDENDEELPTALHVLDVPKPKEIKTKRALRGTSLLQKHGFSRPTAPQIREVAIPEVITVGELAQRLSVKANEVIKSLMKLGTMATINQTIDQSTASVIVEEFGHKVKLIKGDAIEDVLQTEAPDREHAVARPPVVTIMGHVDHGKTSLLDYIRRTQVAAKEAGGITQHIGAYHVTTDHGVITFLDTPGHEAFTAMRARGAQCTDIVVLVVAADDGVMPQTAEAISHSRAAGVPMIVAVNKVDKPDADPERIKTELMKYEVLSEQWGGDTMFVSVSAKTGQGVPELLDAILLQAEMLELKAPAQGPMRGTVIESRLDKGHGAVATVLVQQGLLKKGDIMLAGTTFGRVRLLIDENGKSENEVGPSIPVAVVGLAEVPSAGDDAYVVANEQIAREICLHRLQKQRDQELIKQKAQQQDFFARMGETGAKTLNLVLKADVQGSIEALREVLANIGTAEVQVKIVASGLGGINESDAHLAMASSAMIVGFNVRADTQARAFIEKEKIPLHYYSIIYDVVDDAKKILSGMLDPAFKENILGLAEVRDVFRSSKFGAIAGCMVTEGQIRRNRPIRVLRANVVIFEGELESLRRFKDDVSEVRQGMECGIGVKSYNDIRPGDQIEVFERVKVERSL